MSCRRWKCPWGRSNFATSSKKTASPTSRTAGARRVKRNSINKKLVGELALPYTVPLLLGLGTGIVIGGYFGQAIPDTAEERHARGKAAMARQ